MGSQQLHRALGRAFELGGCGGLRNKSGRLAQNGFGRFAQCPIGPGQNDLSGGGCCFGGFGRKFNILERNEIHVQNMRHRGILKAGGSCRKSVVLINSAFGDQSRGFPTKFRLSLALEGSRCGVG